MGSELSSNRELPLGRAQPSSLRFPSIDSAPNTSETISGGDPIEAVRQWASQYAQTIFSWEGTPADLNAHIGQMNKAFIARMSALLQGDARAKLLYGLHQVALEAFTDSRDKLYEEVTLSDHRFREEVETLVNAFGEEVGVLHGPQGSPEAISQRRGEYEQLRPEIVLHLTRQILDGHPASAKQREHVVQRVTETLESLWDQAQTRGEERVLAAETMAHTLRQAVSPSRKNRDLIYKTLFPLPAEDLKLVSDVYEHRYGEPLLTTVERAHDSVVAKVKNFFQFPALRAALQDEYGIGAGLLSAWRVFVPKLRDLKSYPDRVGDFIHRLRDKVASPETHRISALLGGERIQVATDTIYMAILYNDDAVATISTTLKGLNAEDTKLMLEDFKQRYASRLCVKDLAEAIDQRFEGDERKLLFAYLAVDDLRGAAIVFHDSLDEKNQDKVEALLELHQLTAEELAEVRAKYTQEYGQEPSRAYLKELLKGPLLDWADALLQGDSTTASAARLEASLRNISDEWPGVVFHNQSKEADYAVLDAYRKLYKKDFFEALKAKRGSERAEIMRSYVEKAHLTPAELMRHCLIGLGADSSGVARCLKGLSKAEQAKIDREYAWRYREKEHGVVAQCKAFLDACKKVVGKGPLKEKLRELRFFRQHMRDFTTPPRDLERDLRRNFSGHKRFDVQLLREGVGDDPHALFDQLQRRFRHETHKSLAFLSAIAQDETTKKLLGIWKRKPSHVVVCMCQAVADAKKFYERHIAGGTPSEDDKQKSALLCRIAQLSLDRYREYNTNRAHLAANIGSLATTSAALGGLAIFDLSYLSLAVPIGVMSFVGRYAFKRKYQGEGYGARAKAKDVFLSTVDGSSLAFGKWIKVARTFRFFGAGGSLGRGVLSAGTKFVFKRSLHKVGDGALTSLLLADQESGHVKLLSQKERETLLAEIGNVLHTEADRGYRRRDRLFHRTPDINRVFTRLGRELAGQ